MPQDPYAAYSGSAVADDPYAAYGGAIAGPSSPGRGGQMPAEGSPKADFIKNPSGRDYTPKPTWFDEIQQGTPGAILNPAVGAHDEPLKRLISGTGESLGRTTKAWSDALSFHPTDTTAAEMFPIIGPMAVDAVNAMATPGQRLKGLGMAGSMLAPAVMRGGVPKVNLGDLRTSIQDRMFPGDPHEMATQAIKPRASKLDFTNTLKSAMPDMKAAETVPISNVQDALDTVKAAKAQNRAAYDAFRGPAYAIGTLVDMSPVADAIEGSIPRDILFEASRGVPSAVSAVESIRTRANAYRTQVPLAEAESQLMAANAELDAFHAKYPREQWSALATNPETAATYAKAESARTAIYNTLDNPNAGAGAREIQGRYGKLLDIEQELQRRQNVAARQQPQSLSQQLSKAQAFGKLALAGGKLFIGRDPLGAAGSALESAGVKAASDWMKEQQATNALLSRAFRTYKVPQSPFPAPAPVNVAGLLEAPPVRMPRAYQRSLPPASSISGIVPTEIPDFINKEVLTPRMIEASPFDRGLQPGATDPFRTPQTIPVDIPQHSAFPLSRQPGKIVTPKAGTPTEPGVSREWTNEFVKSGANPYRAKP